MPEFALEFRGYKSVLKHFARLRCKWQLPFFGLKQTSWIFSFFKTRNGHCADLDNTEQITLPGIVHPAPRPWHSV